MRFALASQGLEHARRHVASIVQIDNVESRAGERVITWAGRTPGVPKGVYYPIEYQYLLDRQQYSFLLSDGSFFQFFFSFDDRDSLSKAKLAYYPRPISTKEESEDLLEEAGFALERSDEFLYEHYFSLSEAILNSNLRPTNTTHIRFDFDAGVEVHANAHLQFGGIQDFRVPADFVPQPLAFIQMCEGAFSGLPALSDQALGFEINNALRLKRPAGLSCLGHLQQGP